MVKSDQSNKGTRSTNEAETDITILYGMVKKLKTSWDSCGLLLAQHALHILVKHSASVKLKRPDTSYENSQSENRYSGFK
jgi:hypothetical protein